jgi:two-component system sensor histidine kinase KdpD
MREKRIRILYQIERNLLAVQELQQIARVAAKDLYDLFGVPVIVCLNNMQGETDIKHMEGKKSFDSEINKKILQATLHTGVPCGMGTQFLPEGTAYFFPILGKDIVLGAVGIEFGQNDWLTESQRIFLDTIGTQIALALERERLYERQQQAKTEAEREKMRGNLLRAISHDLRTPLTGILGSASTVLNNYSILSDDVKKEFIIGITEDAEWLNSLVENILNMTKFDEGSVQLKKEMEAVEEIVSESVMRVKARSGEHVIKIKIPHQLIMIQVDGILIEQALVNLLDNAIKHTPDGTEIRIAVELGAGSITFEVSDNGPGIAEDEIPLLFNRFYKSGKADGNHRPGIGLGLTICKSIVEAHGGSIMAMNDPLGGAIFRFALPTQRSNG